MKVLEAFRVFLSQNDSWSKKKKGKKSKREREMTSEVLFQSVPSTEQKE